MTVVDLRKVVGGGTASILGQELDRLEKTWSGILEQFDAYELLQQRRRIELIALDIGFKAHWLNMLERDR